MSLSENDKLYMNRLIEKSYESINYNFQENTKILSSTYSVSNG